MFKNLILASTAIVSLGSAALAADLPSRRAPAPYVAVPVFTWTGFYVGANAGYATTENRNTTITGLSAANQAAVGVTRPAFLTNQASGFTGGGQIGYNYQVGSIVFGLEADAAYTDLSSRRFFTAANGSVSTIRTNVDYIGTVRGRLGYAFDRILIYGTGGFAYGGVDQTANFYSPAIGGNLAYFGQRNKTETGWTAGGGVEYALPSTYSFFGSNTVTLKAEALYYDLGRTSNAVLNTPIAPNPPFASPGYLARSENNGILARAGINVKFNTF